MTQLLRGRSARRGAQCGLVLFSLIATPAVANASIARFADDQYEVNAMKAQNPAAVAELEKGEELAASGQFARSIPSFLEVQKSFPDLSLPRRRVCEALLALGHAKEASDICFVALQYRHSNIAVRAVVRGLVDEPEGPPLTQVGEALAFLTMERRRAPHRFMLSSALCDVAERIGDGVMLQRCAEELVNLAPTSSETHHALELLATRCPPWRFWLGWGLLGAVSLGTGVDLLRRSRRKLRGGPVASSGAAAAAALALLVLSPTSATAQEPQAPPPQDRLGTVMPINDSDPESSVPDEKARSKDPLEFGYWLQDVSLKAEQATKRKDYEAAVKYYRALGKAVPDRAVAFARLCDSYEALGDLKMASIACGTALLNEGVRQEDFVHYIRLVSSQKGELSYEDQTKLQGSVEWLAKDQAAHPLVEQLECLVGRRLSNIADLQECTKVLAEKWPNDMQTIEAQFTLATLQHDYAAASRYLNAAKAAGASPEVLAGMEQSLSGVKHRTGWAWVLAAAAIGLFAAGVTMLVRYIRQRRKTLPAGSPVGA